MVLQIDGRFNIELLTGGGLLSKHCMVLAGPVEVTDRYRPPVAVLSDMTSLRGSPQPADPLLTRRGDKVNVWWYRVCAASFLLHPMRNKHSFGAAAFAGAVNVYAG